MRNTVRDPRLDVPLRNAKAELEPVQKLTDSPEPVHKLNPEAGEVLDLARSNARLEPKQMADDMGISHSLVLRGLKSGDHLSFHRLWELPDAFWAELLVAVAKKRRIATVRTTIEIESIKRVG